VKTALITLGSTREYIDPVRYISNESSGQQGVALIRSLLKKNFKVICLHGYVSAKLIKSSKVQYIFTPNAKSMLQEAKKYKNVDLAIFNAAVNDYKVKNFSSKKIKTKNGLTIKLINNPDVLKTISSGKVKPAITIGFAYETHDVFNNAQIKLKKKKCDYMVLNYPTAKNNIFNNLKNNGMLLSKSGLQYNLGHVSKTVFANKIIDTIIKLENAK